MSNFITYKNAQIHFTDEGSGKVVLLIHGFLEHLKMWDDLVPHLSKTHRVICIDLLGHGKTDCLGHVHTMEDMAKAVTEVLSILKLKSATVIGHSMGGYVSLVLLETHPNFVKGICLVNSTPISDSSDKRLNRDRAIKAVKTNCKMFVRLSIANLFRPKSRKLYKDAFENVKTEALKISVQSIIAALEGMKLRKDRLELFKQSNIPRLVILGKKDAILNYKLQRSYYEDTDINIVKFPDGHMSYIENNEEFTYNIMRFIENI